MVFVTVGTQNFNFIRLLKAVERAVINGILSEEVIAQIGKNKFESKYIKCIPFLDKDEFGKYMEEARFIISHSGTGSLISALKRNKKVIVAPRLSKYGEHIDDHQLEILEAFSKMNLIIALDRELLQMEETIQNIDQFKLSKFESNTHNFNLNLIDLIRDL